MCVKGWLRKQELLQKNEAVQMMESNNECYTDTKTLQTERIEKVPIQSKERF